MRYLFPMLCLLMGGLLVHAAKPIVLMGANGREVSFAGVLEATPQGLVLLMKEGGKPMTVAWDKFDMPDLEDRHRKIYDAGVDARSYSKTVPLHLGIYAEYDSYDVCLTKLNKAFNTDYTVSVPNYDDYVKAYQKTYFYSMSDYENFTEARRKVFEDYREFINDFFRNKDIHLNVSQSIYSANVYSADPDKTSVQMSPREVVAYFAEQNNRTRKEAMAYIQNDRRVLEQPLTILREMKEKVPNPLFDTTDADEIYFSTLLENNIRDLEHLNTEKTFPHTALRNFEKLLTAVDKGGAASKAR